MFQQAWDNIVAIFQGIGEFFGGLWDNVTSILSGIGDWFRNMFQGAWEGIKNAFSGVGDFFGGIWQGIQNAFSHVTDWFKNIFSNAWQAVKNVFSAGGKNFDGIKEGIVNVFKTVVNGIIGGINKVIAVPFNAINGILEKIKGIEIVGIKPFDWIHSFNVPQIPQLEMGTVVKKGKPYLLEGKGDEAVVPLHKNKYWIKAVANDMKEQLKGNNAATTNNISNTTSNTNNFTQIINAPKQPSRLQLYRQTKNLLNLVNANA